MSDDDREWNDPPGVWDDEEEDTGDNSALSVATEGESFISEAEEREREPIEPQELSVESILFVLFGALVAGLVLAQLVTGLLG